MLRIVRTLADTSSPCVPSPRVTARTNRPFSYVSEIAVPSNFSSQQYAVGTAVSLSTRAMKSRTSSSE